MNLIRFCARRLRGLFRKDKLDAEMAEEMRAHLEMQAERHRAASLSPDEAHFAALRAFGGVEQIKERCRDQRGWGWLEQGWGDLRQGGRQLARTPGFTGEGPLPPAELCIRWGHGPPGGTGRPDDRAARGMRVRTERGRRYAS